MNDHYKLMERVYSEIGMPAPEVTQYGSVEEIFYYFDSWKSKAQPFVANYWEYQYPLLHPDGYWCRNHLHNSNFQIDIRRSANEHGAFVHSELISEIDVKASSMFHRYISAVSEEMRNTKPTQTNNIVLAIMQDYEGHIDSLEEILSKEDPTNQGCVEEYIFLGAFDWLLSERQLLSSMREYVQRPICNEHYENVVGLCESNALYLTFRNNVLFCSL